MELPINMIVIIAVAVLVLAVIIALFVGAIGGEQNRIVVEQAFTKGCLLLKANQACDPARISDVTIAGYRTTTNGIVEDPTSDGVYFYPKVCNLKGATSEASCAQLCGCVI